MKIRIETSADVSGAKQAQGALKSVADEARELDASVNIASRDVARLEAAVENLRAKRRALLERGIVGGDTEGFTRQGNAYSNAIDRLNSRRDSIIKANPSQGDLSSSAGADFQKILTPKVTGLGVAIGDLENILAKVAIAAGAAKLGWEAGNYVQDRIFNWASSLAAGGWSSEEDQRRAVTGINETGARTTGFYERAKKVTTNEEKTALMKEAEQYQQSLLKQKSTLMPWDTAQKTALTEAIQQVQDFWDSALKLDPAAMAEMARKKQAAIKRAADQAAVAAGAEEYLNDLNSEESRKKFNGLNNQEKLADVTARRNAARQVAADPGGGDFSPDQIAQARKEDVELTRQVAQYEALVTAEKEKQAALAEKARQTEASLTTQLKIGGLRSEGKNDEADRLEHQIKLQKELEALKAKGVTNEKLLAQYQEQRNTEFESGLKARQEEFELDTQLKEAIATGNKSLEEKVRWMQEYLDLQRQGKTEDEAARAANANSGARLARGESSVAVRADSPLGVRPGNLYDGTNHRRGLASSSGIDAPIDLLNPTRPRGLGPEVAATGSAGFGTAGSGAAGPQSSAPGGGRAPGAEATEKSADKLTEAVKEMDQKISSSLEKCGSAFTGVAGKISAKFSSIEQRLSALENGL